MMWVGEELLASEQTGQTLAPRWIKDVVEERLFARRAACSLTFWSFMDTTSLYFEGRGGETLAHNGMSKEYRPHLKQMIVRIITDQDRRSVCSEM